MSDAEPRPQHFPRHLARPESDRESRLTSTNFGSWQPGGNRYPRLQPTSRL
jgi:hypothetical protein